MEVVTASFLSIWTLGYRRRMPSMHDIREQRKLNLWGQQLQQRSSRATHRRLQCRLHHRCAAGYLAAGRQMTAQD